jgi:hypothetical protein
MVGTENEITMFISRVKFYSIVLLVLTRFHPLLWLMGRSRSYFIKTNIVQKPKLIYQSSCSNPFAYRFSRFLLICRGHMLVK